jgi:hypothetical protein
MMINTLGRILQRKSILTISVELQIVGAFAKLES